MDQGAVTVLQLITAIRNQVFSSGEPENLVTSHDQLFQEALAEIAKWVECEREDNVNVIDFARTFYHCRMTIVPAVRGTVDGVYTLADGLWSNAIHYDQVEWPELEVITRQRLIVDGVDAVLPDLPLGFVPASADNDKPWGRALSGKWALRHDKIYLYPWIDSEEKVVVEWRGLKTEWADDDLINPDQDYKKAIKLYFQYAHERDYGDPQKSAIFKVGMPPGSGGFDQALGDLRWECRERTKMRDPSFLHACHCLILAATTTET